MKKFDDDSYGAPTVNSASRAGQELGYIYLAVKPEQLQTVLGIMLDSIYLSVLPCNRLSVRDDAC